MVLRGYSDEGLAGPLLAGLGCPSGAAPRSFDDGTGCSDGDDDGGGTLDPHVYSTLYASSDATRRTALLALLYAAAGEDGSELDPADTLLAARYAPPRCRTGLPPLALAPLLVTASHDEVALRRTHASRAGQAHRRQAAAQWYASGPAAEACPRCAFVLLLLLDHAAADLASLSCSVGYHGVMLERAGGLLFAAAAECDASQNDESAESTREWLEGVETARNALEAAVGSAGHIFSTGPWAQESVVPAFDRPNPGALPGATEQPDAAAAPAEAPAAEQPPVEAAVDASTAGALREPQEPNPPDASGAAAAGVADCAAGASECGGGDGDAAAVMFPGTLRAELVTLAPKVALLDRLGAPALEAPGARATLAACVALLLRAADCSAGSSAADVARGTLWLACGGGPPSSSSSSASSSSSSASSSSSSSSTKPSHTPVEGSLELGLRGDAVVAALAAAFITDGLGRAACGTFVRAVLLKKCLALTKPASRLLAGAVTAAAKTRPDLVIEHLVLPLLCRPATEVNSAHCELATRVIKSGGLSSRALDGVTRALAQSATCIWSDLTVPVLAACLASLADATASEARARGGGSSGGSGGPRGGGGGGGNGPAIAASDLSLATAAALVDRLGAVVRASAPLRASLKVANLVHALATRHAAAVVAIPPSAQQPQHAAHQERDPRAAVEVALRSASARLESFVARSAEAALDRAKTAR